MHEFLRRVNDLQLHRASATVPSRVSSPINGMSPKKSHEVRRLSTYIRGLCESSSAPQIHPEISRNDTPFVVDVGAGQGYLARELAFPSTVSARPMHVLALESDMNQIDGANRRGTLSGGDSESCRLPIADGGTCERGSITYRNSLVSRDSLAQEIESWIVPFPCNTRQLVDHIPSGHNSRTRTYPLIITGLHACGSLTPTVLRSFISLADSRVARLGSHSSNIQWEPSALKLALVGCCYNLMKESGESTCNSLPMLGTGATNCATQTFL